VLEENQLVTEQGSDAEPSLLILLSGVLRLSQESPFESEESNGESPSDEPAWSSAIYPKEMLGGLQLLTNEPASMTIKTASPCVIARIDRANFEKIVELQPSIVLPVAYSVLRRLSSFIRAVDFALDWILVDSGQALYRQDDMAEALYVVLSGRLRSVSKKVAIEEFGRGDVLGMMEVLQVTAKR
jgi:lysophospholipid hydrolase